MVDLGPSGISSSSVIPLGDPQSTELNLGPHVGKKGSQRPTPGTGRVRRGTEHFGPALYGGKIPTTLVNPSNLEYSPKGMFFLRSSRCLSCEWTDGRAVLHQKVENGPQMSPTRERRPRGPVPVLSNQTDMAVREPV